MELLDVFRRLKTAGAAFGIVLLFGSSGYYWISGGQASMVDAFYMTAITISTIGFHEVIDLSASPYGRLFTVFLAFSGFGVLTYFISNVVALFIEGDLRRTFEKKKMEKMIHKIENHYIICGCGRVGRNIASELQATERPFVMADISQENIDKLVQDFPKMPYLIGDATDEDFLIKLGLERAMGLFVVTGDDNTNLVACLTARQIHGSIKIVARSKEVSNSQKLKRAGANQVVTPNFIGGLRMASEMLRPTVTSFLDEMMRSNFNQRLEEVIIPPNFDGCTIKELPLSDLPDTLLLALRQKDTWIYNPSKSTELISGDAAIFMTTPGERKKLEDRITK